MIKAVPCCLAGQVDKICKAAWAGGLTEGASKADETGPMVSRRGGGGGLPELFETVSE
jgi:hypothetical protein